MGSAWKSGLLDSYRGKRVLVTGHTGFKGSWLSLILAHAGAQVTGYALEAPTDPSLFELARIGELVDSRTGDIRDFDKLASVFAEARPEYVFHLAAQPIVRIGYDEPRRTFETNVMGTVNVLECVRRSQDVRSVLNVTTDKVYLNADEPDHAFTEDEPLDGFDPYSNSKSCSELVTHSYAKSFSLPPVSTARAGNVIGGGDFAPARLVPDCVRATLAGRPIGVRNPASTRPFQHVLEPLGAYLLIAARQGGRPELAGAYNVGPDRKDAVTAQHLVELWCTLWGEGADWTDASDQDDPKHEAAFLELDNSKLKDTFGWSASWDIDQALEKTVSWTKDWVAGVDPRKSMLSQIEGFFAS